MKRAEAYLVLFIVMCIVTFTIGHTKRQERNVFEAISPDKIMDVTDFSVYYEIATNKTITNMMPRPWYRPGWMLRLPFTGGPCTCKEFHCFCCTGIRVKPLNFDRQTCAILKYEPSDSIIDMEVKMNNDSVYNNTFSARNPPSLCLPIPVPYVPIGLFDFCMRIFDVSVIDQKLHVCLDMDTRIDKAPVLILHFDCMDMGFSGVGLSKPSGGTGGGSGIGQSDANAQPTEDPADIYDPVTDDPLRSGLELQSVVDNDTINVTKE